MDNIRVKTGIPGFDQLVQGGFVEGSANLIAGGTGAGKSIFCLQFLYNGVMKFKETGLYVSFEEKTDSLKMDALNFGWDFDSLEKQKKIKFLYMTPYTTIDLISSLEDEIPKLKIKRVVIDSVSVFAMSLSDQYKIRKQIYTLISLLQRLNCTSLLTSETIGEAPLDITERDGSFSRYGVEEFVADSVVTFHNSGLGGAGDRAIRIVKMRRTNHTKGPVAMQITNKGVEVLSQEKSYK